LLFVRTVHRCLLVGLVGISGLVMACGSSQKSSSSAPPSTRTTGQVVSLSITETGTSARFTAPTSIRGGLVTVTLKNQGKAPHSAQFVLIGGNHTIADALRIIEGNSTKTPSWIRGEGGVAMVAPGQTGTATVDLPPGHYALTEVGSPGGGVPPAATELQVTPGSSAALPSTAATVTADTAGRDKYKWQISGPLAAGSNRITFVSKGGNALHLIAAIRITGQHSKAELIKALESNGRPPAYFDINHFAQTAVLDGGKSQVTQLDLTAPGQYVLFCPLTDRDGGKPHLAEGLLTTITVK
jgi:hypothetical protein